jgi:hypothetical protein
MDHNPNEKPMPANKDDGAIFTAEAQINTKTVSWSMKEQKNILRHR